MSWKFGFPLKKLEKFCKFSLSPFFMPSPPLFYHSPALLKKFESTPSPPFWPILRKLNYVRIKMLKSFESHLIKHQNYFLKYLSKCSYETGRKSSSNPININLFNVSNGNTRTMCISIQRLEAYLKSSWKLFIFTSVY